MEPKYITKAKYEIDPTPPYFSEAKLNSDIPRAFFDADNFARWKDGRPGTLLTVDLILPRQMIDGAFFDVSPNKRLIRSKTVIF